MRYLILLLGLASCSSSKPKPQFAAIHILDIKNADDPALADCIQRCNPDDAALASALKDSVGLQQAYLRRQPVSEAALKASARKLTEAAVAWYQKNKSSQDPAEVLAAYQLAVTSEKMLFPDLTPPSFKSEVNAGIAGLPARFPHDARSYLLYGHYLSHKTPPLEDVIRNYRRCLELDPTIKECRRRYDDAVSDFEASFCTSAGLDKSFGFFLSADRRDAGHPVPLRAPEGKIYVGKKAALSGADVARLMVASAPAEQAEKSEELRIEMTPDGAHKLALLTDSHRGEMLAVALKGRALLNARILSPIREGKISVTMGAEPNAGTKARSVFELACPRPTTQKLPPDLKLDTNPPPPKGA